MMFEQSRQAGEAIAQFLREQGVNDDDGALRVGEIARLPGCPIRPPSDDRWLIKGIVGYEPHCQRVTAALDAACRLRLVLRGKTVNRRTGKATGAWRYHYAPELIAGREARAASYRAEG